MLGFAVSDAPVALSSSYALTFAARLPADAMGGTLWAMLVGCAVRMVPAARRGRAIAVVPAGITLALALGLPAGTTPAGAVGRRTAFGSPVVLAVLLVVWVRLRVPGFTGALPHARVPLVRVAVRPGICPVLSVTLCLQLGHQVMYTYVAPFAAHAGCGRTGGLLAVFGAATVAGIRLRRPGRPASAAYAASGARPVTDGPVGAGSGLRCARGAGRVGRGLRWGAGTDPDRAGRRLGPGRRRCGDLAADHGVHRGDRRRFAHRRGGTGRPRCRCAARCRARAGDGRGGAPARLPAVRRGAPPHGSRVAVSPSVPLACGAGDHAARRSVPHGEGQ
ncbi:MFS transporter [Streptomyces sp. NPDC001340]